MIEQWKKIPGFSGYVASNSGRIKNLKLERHLILSEGLNGSFIVKIYDNEGNRRTAQVSRLVATTFLSNEEGYKYVVHKDMVKGNNTAENLEWASSSVKYRKGSATRNGRPVIQMDTDKNVIKRWDSVQKAAKELGVNRTAISNVCRGCYGVKTSGGFGWKYDDGDIDGEIWKPYKNIKVSNKGRVECISGVKTTGSEWSGYQRVRVKGRSTSVHFLVAHCFLPRKEEDVEVNHIDGNKLNNNAENLEWCTSSQNTQHAYTSGLVEKTPEKNKKSRAVLVYKGDEFYKEYSSVVMACRELKVGRTTIIRQCRGEVKNPRGPYRFKYMTDIAADAFNENSMAILAYKGSELYKEYPSVTMACRELGVGKNTVLKHCKGEIEKPRGLYRFEYA